MNHWGGVRDGLLLFFLKLSPRRKFFFTFNILINNFLEGVALLNEN